MERCAPEQPWWAFDPPISSIQGTHRRRTRNEREALGRVPESLPGWITPYLQQARALGHSLSNVRFAAIYASTLKRALWTGQAVRDAQDDPKPPLTESLLLREQYFGEAEGHPWSWNQTPGLSLEEHFAKGIWPVLHERSQNFPGGESLEDLAVRASKAIDELVMPHIWQAAREGKVGVNIALASHGLCISELIPALLVKDESGHHPGDKYKGLHNTAWTRVTVQVKVYNNLPLVLSSTLKIEACFVGGC